MKNIVVNLIGENGVISYPSYREEDAVMVGGSNAEKITFTPCDADEPLRVTAVTYSEEGAEPVTLPVDILLVVGTSVTFPAGSLTPDHAQPLAMNGAPYFAQVRAIQMLKELMGTHDAAYSLQKMPEAADEYAIVHVTGHETSVRHINEGWDDNGKFYDYNAWAKVTIFRGSPAAIAYLNDLVFILQTRRGYYWQCAKGFDFVVSEEIQNTSPLIDNRSYQQQAQVALKFSFVLRRYEHEGWISHANVEGGCTGTHVTVTPEGE